MVLSVLNLWPIGVEAGSRSISTVDGRRPCAVIGARHLSRRVIQTPIASSLRDLHAIRSDRYSYSDRGRADRRGPVAALRRRRARDWRGNRQFHDRAGPGKRAFASDRHPGRAVFRHRALDVDPFQLEPGAHSILDKGPPPAGQTAPTPISPGNLLDQLKQMGGQSSAPSAPSPTPAAPAPASTAPAAPAPAAPPPAAPAPAEAPKP